MKKINILAALVFLSFGIKAQQELGLHFMDKVWQSNLTNPAFFSQKTVVISLPSVYTNYTNSSFSLKNILQPDGDSMVLDLGNAVNQLKGNNFVAANVNADPLLLGIKIKNLQISVTSGVKANTYFGYDKNLVGLLVNGNEAYINQKVNIAPNVGLRVYSEIGLGAAYRFLEDERLSIGGRVKYLMGLGDISTSKTQNEISIYTDPEFYQLTLQSNYALQSSNIFQGESADSLQFTLDNIRPFSQNNGLGFDIGAQYKINEQFTVSASVIDIGRIKWTENTKEYVTQGTYTYDGIHFDQLLDSSFVNFGAVTDSLGKVFNFKDLNRDEYTTSLPTRFYLSGTYQPIEMIKVGALFYGEKLAGKFNPGILLSGNLSVKEWFTFGLGLGYRNQRFGNIGVNASLKGGPFQVFVATDNVTGFVSFKGVRNANIRTGLNVLF